MKFNLKKFKSTKSKPMKLKSTGCKAFITWIMTDKRGFGMNELLGIAAALILAAFIIIPSLRTFATSVMNGLTSWWGTSVKGTIFPTS